MDSQRIAIDVLPDDVDELRREPSADRWPDLGKVVKPKSRAIRQEQIVKLAARGTPQASGVVC